MASKSKRRKNAFGLFLEDYVLEQRAGGRRVSYKVAAEECTPLWEKMPQEEKQVYMDKAQVLRVYSQKEKETKYTSLGVSFAEMDKREADERMKIERCNQEIESTIEKFNDDTIRKHLFYIIHCHYLVKLDDGTYMPGEIAICEFSLKKGIMKTYHKLIACLHFPTGCAYEAKLRRESIHGLPIPPYAEGASDFCEILTDIFKFIEPGRDSKGKRPPFYALEEEIPAIENILQQFSNKVGQGENFFRVYPIHKLLFGLKNKCAKLASRGGEGFPVLSIALSEVEKDTYRYVSGISCEYHLPSDRFYYACSLSVVQRYVYLISDHCCHFLKISLEPGKHIQINADIKQEVVEGEGVRGAEGEEEEKEEKYTPGEAGYQYQFQEQTPRPASEQFFGYWDHYAEPKKEEPTMTLNDFPQLPSRKGPAPSFSGWGNTNRPHSIGRGQRIQKSVPKRKP